MMKSATSRKLLLIITLLCISNRIVSGVIIPYETMDELHTTMGQLVKLSEAILIGTVAKAENNSAGDTWIECSVEDVILGSEMPEQVMLEMKGKPGPAIHEPQTALVFVDQTRYETVETRIEHPTANTFHLELYNCQDWAAEQLAP